MNEILKATLDLCEADLRKAKVNIEKKLVAGLPKILGNNSELQQALLNLINNAIQAMPRGGTLTAPRAFYQKPFGTGDPRKDASAKSCWGPRVEFPAPDSGVGSSSR